MSRNGVIMAAIGGAAAAALAANYLGTDKGKQMLDNASGKLKDLKAKATDYARKNLKQTSGVGEEVQPS